MTSQEIDRLGEEGEDYAETRRWMDDMLEQLRRAIRILAKQGVEHFIITADHGYLFADQLDPGMLMDSPGRDRAGTPSLGFGSEKEERMPRVMCVWSKPA